MGFVSSDHHDVFITYASADDEPPAGERTQWVTTFAEKLKKIIEYNIGRGPDDVTIWVDKKGVHGGTSLRKIIMDNVRQAHVLLAVLSPSYLKSEWCRRERDAYIDSNATSFFSVIDQRRGEGIFIAEIYPFKDEQIPTELKDLKRYRFWTQQKTGAPARLGLAEARSRCMLNDLGWHIARKLEDCRKEKSNVCHYPSTVKQYRAVISSTTDVLTSYADAIKRKINELDDWECVQLHASDHGRGAETPSLEDTIKACDRFIGMIGQTYSPIIQYGDMAASGAEREYNLALEARRNVMLLVQTDHSGWKLTGDGDTRQLAFRARIQKSGVIDIDFGVSPNEIAEKVVKELLTPKNLPPRIPHSTFIEYPTTYFRGRDSIVANVVGNLRTLTGVLLWGEAGVGKTEITKKVAHDPAIRSFFGTKVYRTRFLGEREGVLPTSGQDAMREIACQIEPDARSQNLEQWNEVFRDKLQLSDQRTLIILDNAPNRDQCDVVLQNVPPTCAVLITAREKIFEPGDYGNIRAEFVPRLERSDGIALLQEITKHYGPRWEQRLERLAEACSYLPQALTTVGHELRENPDADINDYLRKRTGTTREDEVPPALQEMVFKKIAEHPSLIEFWLYLSVFEGEFDANGAAKISAKFYNDAKALMLELLECRLIEPGSIKGFHRVHSLLKDFARRFSLQRYQGGMQNAQMGHASYFCDRLEELCEAFKGASEHLDSDSSLYFFDMQWPDIEKGHAWAVAKSRETNGSMAPIAARLCVEYCIVDRNYLELLNLRLSPAQRITWLDAALQVVPEDDDWGRGKLLDERGVARREMGEPSAALEDHQDACRIAEEDIRDNRLAASALGNIGRAYWEIGGKNDEASEYYERSRAMASGDATQQGRMLDCLGIVVRETAKSKDDVQRALEIHAKAAEMAECDGDQGGRARAIDNLGLDHLRLENFGNAKICFELALGIGRKIRDLALTASILDHIAEVYRQEGGERNLTLAKTRGQEALTEAEYFGDERIIARILGNLGLTHLAIGELRETDECFREQLRLSKAKGDYAGECAAFYHLGLLYLHTGELLRAECYSRKSLYLAIDINKRDMEERALARLIHDAGRARGF